MATPHATVAWKFISGVYYQKLSGAFELVIQNRRLRARNWQHGHEPTTARPTAQPVLKLLHETLFALLKIERRFDPFFRPALDAIFQEPLARGLQFLTNLLRDREILRLAEERKLLMKRRT